MSPSATPEVATTDADTASKPAVTVRAGRGISASVFERRSDKGVSYYSISVQKRYKDKDGTWQTSTNYLKDELPLLRHVVAKAQEFVIENDLRSVADE